jgi:hypothetical protein
MNWKLEVHELIESTMAFANEIKRGQPIPLPVALGTVEQALADTSTPIPPPAMIAPTASLVSQREEIRERVRIFKAHQERMTREREEYYLQVKARMLAPVDPNPC